MRNYLLLRTLSDKEVEQLEAIPDKKVVVAQEMSKTSPNCSFEKLSLDPDEDLFKQSYDILEGFPHREYSKGSMAQALLYQGVSLFYYTRFILFNRFVHAYKELKAFQQFEEEHSNEGDVIVYNSSPYLKPVLERQGLSFIQPEKGKEGKLPLPNLAGIFLGRLLVGLFYAFRLFKARHLFILPPVEKQPILNRFSLKLEEGNPITDYFLVDLLKRKDAYIFEEFYPAKFVRFDFKRENFFGLYPSRAIYFEPFVALAFVSSLFRRRRWKQYLAREAEIHSLIDLEEKDESIRLMNRIDQDLMGMRRFALLRISAARLFFKNSRLKSIGGIDEYGLRTKSVFDKAIEEGVSTYSLQHGIIHENHTGYKYHARDSEFNNFPNNIFLFGSDAHDLLVKHHYGGPMTLTGQIRTDIIPTLKEKHSEISIKEHRSGAPLIVYASQPDLPGDDPSIRHTINRDFFKLSKEFPEADFILKPHPREYETSYFHQMAKEVGTTNYSVASDDLYLLLSKCTALLTHCSSVGAEAVYFDKPLVVQDYKDVDIVNYIKDGVGIKATNLEELKAAISDILEGRYVPDSKAYFEYKNRFNGPIDGKASQRIMDVINGL